MNNIFKYLRLVLLLLVMAESGNAQEYTFYKGSGAVISQVKGNITTESRLKDVVITLSDNSSFLNVRLNIPYQVINYIPAGDTLILFPDLAFKLAIHINLWQIQNYLTSDKMFVTQGSLTLNNITRTVRVEYLPYPAPDGDINLSMIIQFNAVDFGLDEQQTSSKFIIKISDATVNRI